MHGRSLATRQTVTKTQYSLQMMHEPKFESPLSLVCTHGSSCAKSKYIYYIINFHSVNTKFNC